MIWEAKYITRKKDSIIQEVWTFHVSAPNASDVPGLIGDMNWFTEVTVDEIHIERIGNTVTLKSQAKVK
jgi:hypothetical protein